MTKTGSTFTCACILNKRTQKTETFSLKISEEQRASLIDDVTLQRRIADAFGHVACRKLGWSLDDCKVSILPPYGAQHEKYLRIIASLGQEVIDGTTVDVTGILV